MASLSRDSVTGIYRIHFRFAGKQHHKSLKTDKWREADALRGRVEGFLLELERGRRTLPPGVDAKGFWRLVLSDGKLDAEPELRKALSLAALFKWDED